MRFKCNLTFEIRFKVQYIIILAYAYFAKDIVKFTKHISVTNHSSAAFRRVRLPNGKQFGGNNGIT